MIGKRMRYFGNANKVTRAEAEARFQAELAGKGSKHKDRGGAMRELLIDDDLLTPAERRVLQTVARKDKGDFAELLSALHSLGARLKDLVAARVSDFNAGTKTITRGTRRIVLPTDVLRRIERLCRGRGADKPIFADASGAAFTLPKAKQAFARCIERANAKITSRAGFCYVGRLPRRVHRGSAFE